MNGSRVRITHSVYDQIPDGTTGVIESDFDSPFPEFRPDDLDVLKIVREISGTDTVPLAPSEFELLS